MEEQNFQEALNEWRKRMKRRENFRMIYSRITLKSPPPPHTHTHSLSPQCFLSRRPLKPNTHKHTRSSSPLKQRNIQTRFANNRRGLGNNRNPLSAAFLGIVNKLPKRFFMYLSLATVTSTTPPRFQSAFLLPLCTRY